jgi:D-glycero-D-manno-heptose 1,7-bisphosphate phosphatase
VFLDRDGVLNGTVVEDGVPRPPADVDHVVILPGVAEALELLGGQGLLRVVVTNQPDVARGHQSREMVERINRHLLASLPLDAVYTCFHDDEDRCDCRKPAPGLLRTAALAHDIDLARSYLVGDRWKDVAAGRAAGCETFLIGLPYSQRERCPPHHDASDLLAAARRIVGLVRRSEEGA